MQVVIVRREFGITPSMDVYADNLVANLKIIRPDWSITEIAPRHWNKHCWNKTDSWQSGTGLRKYYERFWRHPQSVSQLQGDIFHIIDHSNAHVAYRLKKSGQRVVVTCHDLIQCVYPEFLRTQSRFPALSRWAWNFSVQGMSQANCVIAVSKNTAQDVAHLLSIEPAQIEVVPNGVNAQFRQLPAQQSDSFRQIHGTTPDTICLLNVGTTVQRKNILTVLKVLRDLRDQGLSVCLWRVGESFSSDQQTFIQFHGLENAILHFGKPDIATLIQIYNAADVLLTPSLYEGFGLTVLEAMACGTPVITSNVSSLPEVAGDAAVLVDPLDVSTICQTVLRLHGDATTRQNLINQGLTRARMFTWRHTAEQIADIYERLS